MKDYNHLRNQKRNNCHDFFKILGYTYIKIFEIIISIFLIIYSYIYNESNFQYISSPKISIFLPIYNKAKYLKRSIHSIQIQTLKEIEIITVNDCSNDNSLKILKKMAEKDSRIKIVNNNKNRGLLYSRAMGILYSKGEYLMNLDPDDKLEGPDNLEYLYEKAYQSKADIVSFGFLEEINFQLIKIIKCENYDKILVQPQIFKNGNNLSDYLITNKLIKKKLLFNAFKHLENKIYGEKWNYGEDEIWSILVNKHANSMICVNKIIFIYYSNNDSLTHNKYNILYFSNMINWLEMLMKIFEEKIYWAYLKKQVSSLINLFEDKQNFLFIKNNTQIKNKYINILNKIITDYNFYNTIFSKLIKSLKSI